MRCCTLVAALVLAAGCVPAMGQALSAADLPAVMPAGATPKLVFTQSGIDFGQIRDSEVQEHQFEFVNSGSSMLTILEARGSCGCTVPQLTKNTYAPGESGTIKVIFNPANRRGQQSQTVTVRSNDPQQPTVNLSVRALVEPRVMADPQSLSYGFVPKGAGPTMDVSVAGIDPSFDVTKAYVAVMQLPENMRDAAPTWDPAEVFQVTMGDRTEKKVGDRTYFERVVKVTISKDAPIGMLRNIRLHIEHNDTTAKPFELPIIATQLGDITMTPPRMSFGRVSAGKAFSQQVIIRSSSGQPFEITSIEHSGNAEGAISYELEAIPESNNSAYKMTLKSDGLSTMGAVRGKLLIHTNVEDEEIVEYAYVGAVMPESGTTSDLVPTQVRPTPPAGAQAVPTQTVPAGRTTNKLTPNPATTPQDKQ